MNEREDSAPRAAGLDTAAEYDDRTWRKGIRSEHIERETMPDQMGAVMSIMMVGRTASYCGRDVTDWPVVKPDDLARPCDRCLRGWYHEDD